MALISLDNVSKIYPKGTRPALDDINLDIERGDFVFLVGASGSGKTTLLSLLLREEEATNGEIRVAGNDLRRITNRQVPQYRRSLGFVFQDYKLLNNKTVWENVAFALEVIGTRRSTIKSLVPKVLDTVGLTGKEKNYPHELSGGEQQRVAIARAYVNHPQILLADEPTGNLDPTTSLGIMEVLDAINRTGTTIVMATHNEEIVNSMRKRVVELHNGKIVRDEAHGSYDSALFFPDAEVEAKSDTAHHVLAAATKAIEGSDEPSEGIARLANSVHSGRTGRYGETFAPLEDTLTWAFRWMSRPPPWKAPRRSTRSMTSPARPPRLPIRPCHPPPSRRPRRNRPYRLSASSPPQTKHPTINPLRARRSKGDHMRARFILSETWANLTRNLSMLLSLTLVTFISFLFIGASVLTQAQITKAKGDWYDKVEVVVWLCPDGTSQSANCASGKSPSANEITALQKTIRDELNDVVSNIDYVSKQDFYDNTFTKQYPNGEFQGRTLTADDMQDSLWLKLKDPTKYQVVSEVLSGKEGVEDVTDQRQIFDPVFAVLNRATAVTAVLAGVMVVVAILLTGTTIRMSAASRRTETEIMRYVGASNWTIRLPFILEGTIASLIGSVLSCLMLSAIVNVFVTGWLAKSVTWIPYVNQLTVLVISPFLVVGAILLSIIASTISLRRYLRA